MTTEAVPEHAPGGQPPAGPAPQKRARGAPRGNLNALVHGNRTRRRLLKEIDWTVQLDRRTTLYRELRERAERIVNGAGGVKAIGPNRLVLASHAAQVELELECLNQAIRDQGPIDRRRNAARRLVEDRNRLLKTYRDLLETIGLDRRAAVPGATLAELNSEYARKRAARAQNEPAPEAAGDPPAES